jgi:hypothetical protein
MLARKKVFNATEHQWCYEQVTCRKSTCYMLHVESHETINKVVTA